MACVPHLYLGHIDRTSGVAPKLSPGSKRHRNRQRGHNHHGWYSWHGHGALIGLGAYGTYALQQNGGRAGRTRTVPRTRVKAGRTPISLPLLTDETGAILMLPSITTVTFYEGEVDVEILRGMTFELIRANPWLAGQLRRDNATGIVHLWIPSALTDLTKHFIQTRRDDLKMHMPLMDMRRLLQDLTVKPGIQCVDSKDEGLFSVALVSCGMARQVSALVVSMSHVLGDGFTYYRLYGALDQRRTQVGGMMYEPNEGPARCRLNPFRCADFPPRVMEALGPPAKWPSSRKARMGSMLDALLRPRHRWQAWYVDEQWLSEEKERFSDSNGFVSSNDVLTSWFFNHGHFDYGIMSVNFRNRDLCGLDRTQAGNYKAGVAFWPEDFASPKGIRSSLQRPPYFRAKRQDVPGVMRSVLRSRVAVATNWASVYQELTLQHCQQLLHLPVLGDVQVHGAMIIFRPQKKTLGLVLGERRLWPRSSGAAMAQQIC